MNKPKITVVDYGMGNLLSVTRALEHCGAEVALTHSPMDIESAERLVLPGVGAFSDGMAGLRSGGLDEAIKRFAGSGRALLGICLGMQMLMESSEEFGHHAGLGLVPGNVEAIPATSVDGQPHKIPHIGWNKIFFSSAGGDWRGSILEGLDKGDSVYFVHSFAAAPADSKNRLADCDYNGRPISAVIRKGSIYGCQFHPEKSGPVGLKILNNFISI